MKTIMLQVKEVKMVETPVEVYEPGELLEVQEDSCGGIYKGDLYYIKHYRQSDDDIYYDIGILCIKTKKFIDVDWRRIPSTLKLKSIPVPEILSNWFNTKYGG